MAGDGEQIDKERQREAAGHEQTRGRIDFSSYRRYRETTDAMMRELFSLRSWRDSFLRRLSDQVAEAPEAKRSDLILPGAILLISLALAALLTFFILRGQPFQCLMSAVMFVTIAWFSSFLLRAFIYGLSQMRQPYIRNLSLGTLLVLLIGIGLLFWGIPWSLGFVLGSCIFSVFVAVLGGFALSQFPIRLTLKYLVIVSILTAVVSGAAWALLLHVLYTQLTIAPAELIGDIPIRGMVLIAYWTFWILFPVAWELCCVIVLTPIWLRLILKGLLDKWRSAARFLHRVHWVLNEQLRINRVYSYSLIGLIPYALLALLSDVISDPYHLLGNYSLMFGMLIGTGLVWVTINYLVIPQELRQVRMDTPGFISRPILQALVVLGLLLGAWWVLYALLFLNWNVVSPGAFEYTAGSKARPDIGDYLFYSFALVTNANYGDVRPVDWGAKVLVMTETLIGLVLLVVFIGAALARVESGTAGVDPAGQSDGGLDA